MVKLNILYKLYKKELKELERVKSADFNGNPQVIKIHEKAAEAYRRKYLENGGKRKV